jgi:cell wall assembly regulator SMI1
MNEIAQNFKKLKEWLGENYPEGLEALNLPATNKEITKLKDTLGFDIPQELEELLRCHNGQPFEKIGVFDE